MLKVKIAGMSCQHCVKRVDNALKDLQGVVSAKVSVGEAVIDGNVSQDLVKETIEDAGYDVEEISAI
ncbi:heavy-metal-associated domain-containing protein [Alloiococcus sp. CFN-8]|uniref:heavy-metal-associated domain-containing protein n=1 Tax=Alloiococcus sp. CFN-8 TaxID=3416081 RepID=UPI003CF494EC